MRNLSKKDKKLLAFIIVGFAMCLVLGGVIVHMCTYNPYIRDDYDTRVNLADVTKVKVEIPSGTKEGLSENECILKTWEDYMRHCSNAKPTDEMIDFEYSKLYQEYETAYKEAGKDSGLSFEDWLISACGYDLPGLRQTLNVLAEDTARHNVVPYAYCITNNVDLSKAGYQSYIQSLNNNACGLVYDETDDSYYSSYVEDTAAKHLYKSVTAK